MTAMCTLCLCTEQSNRQNMSNMYRAHFVGHIDQTTETLLADSLRCQAFHNVHAVRGRLWRRETKESNLFRLLRSRLALKKRELPLRLCLASSSKCSQTYPQMGSTIAREPRRINTLRSGVAIGSCDQKELRSKRLRPRTESNQSDDGLVRMRASRQTSEAKLPFLSKKFLNFA